MMLLELIEAFQCIELNVSLRTNLVFSSSNALKKEV